MKFARSLRAVLALSFAFVSHATAQSVWPWQLDKKLVAPDTDAGDRFGHAVAAQGPFALVGAPYDDEAGQDAGAVYSFRNVGGSWVFDAKILSSHPRADGHFGFAVALDSGFAVVGSPTLSGTATGDAFVLRHDGTSWVHEQRVLPAQLQLWYGAAVDIWRGTLVVSGRGVPTAPQGRAYVYSKGTGGWSQVFAASGLLPYGTACSVFDHTLLVGSPGSNNQSVFVYRESAPGTWAFASFVTPSEPDTQFGTSVALGQDVAAVGSVSPPLSKGRVELFDCQTANPQTFSPTGAFTEQSPLFAPTEFGRVLQFLEDPGEPANLLIVGEARRKFTTKNDGMAHVFARVGTEWQRVARITAPDAATFDEFGHGVAITGLQVVVGAWQADAPTPDSGAAYTYDLQILPTVYCTAKTNTLGCAPAITWNGVPSASVGSGFDIGCVDALPEKLGVLFYSDVADIVPFRGGWLCIAAPLKRAVTQHASSGSFCDGAYTTDFNAFIAAGHDPALIAGESRYCQWATRDPADAWGSGLSQALWFEIGP
ncbi:MAG: FG-GAP repeat protein [Planctomycetes bacterium]|nr:FG-GAP repeat protein [Planctomycetota bacterium]